MTKNFFLILFLIFFNSCSFDTRSGFWTKETKISELNEIELKKIFAKKEINNEELNIDLKVKPNFNTVYLDKENKNNYGPIEENFELEKLSSYKFKKIDYFDQFEPELVFFQNDLIFFEKNGTIIRFNEKGEIVWKVNHYSKSEKKNNPLLRFTKIENKILVSDSFAKFYLIDSENGELIWNSEHKVSFISQIKIDDDKFFVLDSNNTLNCFSLVDGKKIWEFKGEYNLISSKKLTSLIIDDNQVIFNNLRGEIFSLNKKNGNLNWITPVISYKENIKSFLTKSSDLVLNNKQLLISNNRNNLYSINSNTGLITWQQNVSSFLRPILIDNLIFLITTNGYLNIIDFEKGNIIKITDILKNYKIKKRKKIEIVGFIISKEKILVSTSIGHLILVDLESGLSTKILKISRGKISKPYVNDKNLYIIKDNQIIKMN